MLLEKNNNNNKNTNTAGQANTFIMRSAGGMGTEETWHHTKPGIT